MAVHVHRSALDIARVADGNGHVHVGDQVFELDLLDAFDDLGAARVGVIFLDFAQLLGDHDLQLFLAPEDFLQLRDQRLNLLQFFEYFFPLELRQAVKLQVQDGLRLAFAELPSLHQSFARFLGRLAAADQLDDVVQMFERFLEAEQDVLALFGLAQLELRAPPHHFDAVLDEQLQQRQQTQLARLPVHNRQQDHSERFLHLRELEQVVQNNFRFFAAFHFDDDAHAFAVGFIAHVGDAFDLFRLHQLGDALDQAGLVNLVRNLGDDDVLAVLADAFDRGLGAHGEAAAPGFVRRDNAVTPGNVPGRRKIRPRHQLHDFLECCLRLLDQQNRGVNDFAQIVRRNVRRHAHGDAARPIHQQIRNPRGQHDRLFARLVEVGNEVHRLFFEIGENFFADFRQARFGVPHRCGRIAVHRAVVPLPVDQRVAHVERLRQAHQRRVNDRFAVRVVVAGSVATDFRAFAVAAIRRQAQIVHRDKDAPLHRLQAVAHVWNRARHDHAHRVIEVRLLHLGLNFDRNHV